MPDREEWKSDNEMKKGTKNENPHLQGEDRNTERKEVNPNEIPVHHRIDPVIKKKPSWIMPVLLTVLTAGVIGTVLGLFMMQLFTGLDEEQALDETPQTSASAPATKSTETIELPLLTAYVLQTGVFLEKANAEEWSEFYEAAGEMTFVWNREEEYYLFLGIYGMEDEARAKVEELQENGVDVFMKEWEAEIKSVTAGKEEIDWLVKFHETWVKALEEREIEELLSLAQQAPSQSILAELINTITASYQVVDEFFLAVMHAYDQI